MGKKTQYLWYSLWILLGASIFTSKSGISLFGTLLLLWSFFKFEWKVCCKYNPWVMVILSFFPLAVFVSFFSVSDGEAAFKVVRSWPWPLYIIPFSLLFDDKKAFKYFLWSAAFGLFVACLKSFVIFAHEYHWQIVPGIRLESFWDVGRWGYFLSCTSVILFGLIVHESFNQQRMRIEKMAIILLSVLTLICLLLTGSRGAWLASLVGIGILGISSKRFFKFLCGLLIVLLIFLPLIPGVSDRFKSSFSAKVENGVVSSVDASNAGRLHMWKVNLDLFSENIWFGTGFRSTETVMREFLSRQTENYQKTFIDSEFSLKDQHNSYLLVLVQLGVPFFIYFWFSIGWITISSLADFFRSNDILFKISFAVVVSNLFVFMFYSAVSSYEMLMFFPFLLLITKQSGNKFSLSHLS